MGAVTSLDLGSTFDVRTVASSSFAVEILAFVLRSRLLLSLCITICFFLVTWVLAVAVLILFIIAALEA